MCLYGTNHLKNTYLYYNPKKWELMFLFYTWWNKTCVSCSRSGPGGSAVKNPPAIYIDAGLIAGSGRYPGGGIILTFVFLHGESLDRGAWWAAVHGVTKSWTDWSNLAHMHAHFKKFLRLPNNIFFLSILKHLRTERSSETKPLRTIRKIIINTKKSPEALMV